MECDKAAIPTTLVAWARTQSKRDYELSWIERCQTSLEYMTTTYMHLSVLLANFVSAISYVMIMSPLCLSQRSIQDIFAALNQTNPVWTPQQWEMFLRRNITEWPETWISLKDTQWLIWYRHPMMHFCLMDLILMYQNPTALDRDASDRLTAVFKTLEGKENTEVPRLERFYNHLTLFMKVTQKPSDQSLFLKTIFLKPMLKVKRFLIKIANNHTIPIVMRRFIYEKYLWEDMQQLDSPFIIARATESIEKLQRWIREYQEPMGPNPLSIVVDAYLVEQTALSIEISISFYMIGPFAEYRDQIYIYPRTTSTCYVITTNLAMQALRYAFLTEFVAPNKIETRSKLTQENTNNRPFIFPILYRTWLEAVQPVNNNNLGEENARATGNITQHPKMKTIALQQSILAMMKLCYIIANKNLFNTWMEDKYEVGDKHNQWTWNSSMMDAMFSMEEPAFVPYYSQLFRLMGRVWPNNIQLRNMMLEAAQNLPSIDDYLAPKCSIFAFMESFVFVGASHGIRRDTIDWLFDFLSKIKAPSDQMDVDDNNLDVLEAAIESQRANEIYKELPTSVWLVNVLMEKCRQPIIHQPGDSLEQQQWTSTWLVLPGSDKDTRFLVVTYYALCMISHWSFYEVQRLLLSCRLSPNHRIASLDPLSAQSKQPNDEASNNNSLDNMDESSMDFSSAGNKEELEEASILRQLRELQEWTERIKYQSIDDLMSDDDLDREESSYGSDDFSHSTDTFDPSKGTRKRARANSIQMRHNSKRFKPDSTFVENDSAETAKRLHSPRNWWNYFNHMIFNQMIIKQDFLVSEMNQSISFMNSVPIEQRQLELEWFFTLEECSKVIDIRSFEYSKLPNLRDGLLDCFKTNNSFMNHLARDNQKLNVESSWFDSFSYANVFAKQIQSYGYKTNQLQYKYFTLLTDSHIRMFFDCEVFHIPSTVHRLLRSYPTDETQRHVLECIYESSIWNIDTLKESQLGISDKPKLSLEELAKKMMPPPPPIKVKSSKKNVAHIKKKPSSFSTKNNNMFSEWKF